MKNKEFIEEWLKVTEERLKEETDPLFINLMTNVNRKLREDLKKEEFKSEISLDDYTNSKKE